MLIPPRDSLRNSPLLSEEFFAGEPIEFSRVEIDRMREDLDAVVMREAFGLPSLSGLAPFRYNRVEALSAAARRWMAGERGEDRPYPHYTLHGEHALAYHRRDLLRIPQDHVYRFAASVRTLPHTQRPLQAPSRPRTRSLIRRRTAKASQAAPATPTRRVTRSMGGNLLPGLL